MLLRSVIFQFRGQISKKVAGHQKVRPTTKFSKISGHRGSRNPKKTADFISGFYIYICSFDLNTLIFQKIWINYVFYLNFADLMGLSVIFFLSVLLLLTFISSGLYLDIFINDKVGLSVNFSYFQGLISGFLLISRKISCVE